MMILGRKIGMSHVYNEKGHLTPVTLIGCDKNVVVGHKTPPVDGYQAIQIATYGSKHLSQPIQSFLKKNHIEQPLGVIREFHATDDEQSKLTPGSEIELTHFRAGDTVKVTARSKGKGFAGTIKRHGFARGPKTHGSNNYRQPGSIGAQQPQRVIKGKKMAGHQGAQRVTIRKATVLSINEKLGLLVLKGSVPGPNRGLIEVRQILNHES